jgi:hypothetical protein
MKQHLVGNRLQQSRIFAGARVRTDYHRPPSATALNMSPFQVDPELPPITPAESLTGWHREFCIELLGEGGARIFVRRVEKTSLKATEQQRGILFHRLDPRFADVVASVQALQPELTDLASTARRTPPTKDNLYTSLEFDRAAWERVQEGIDRWVRRR